MVLSFFSASFGVIHTSITLTPRCEYAYAESEWNLLFKVGSGDVWAEPIVLDGLQWFRRIMRLHSLDGVWVEFRVALQW